MADERPVDTSAPSDKNVNVKDDLVENLKSRFLKNLIVSFDELVLNFLDKDARDAIIH